MEYQLEDKKYRYSSPSGVSTTDGQSDNDHIMLDIERPNRKNNDEKHIFLNDLKSSSQVKRHFGTHFPFYFINNEPVFTVGPHCKYFKYRIKNINLFQIGPFFLCMWTCLIAVGVLVNIHVANTQELKLRILAFVVTFWEALIYLLTALKNPGIYKSKNQLTGDEKYENDSK